MSKEIDYQQRQRDKGLVPCKVWVPADKRDKLRKYAKQLRERKR